MGVDLANYRPRAHQAVKEFWRTREAARQRQLDSGNADQGERAGVTAGKNMKTPPQSVPTARWSLNVASTAS